MSAPTLAKPTTPTGVVGFAARLAEHGDRVAVLAGDAAVSYRALADRADAVARALGTTRRLVLVEAAIGLDALIGYMGALRGGHAVLVAPAGDPATVAGLGAAWDPDAVVDAAGRVRERRAGTRHALHPDLALLLSTSGSTGSPRLVRLSAAAVEANAGAIADSLGIRADDRPVTTLPWHYCYGLSVVHANLARGAGLVLTDRSVIEPEFWATCRTHGATSLHGVPHTFELLDRVGFGATTTLPSLRYVTQAGGRLAPEQVRRWAAVGAAGGWDLVVMYGQTEATARMAYLPPARAASAPEAIGVAVPGGTLTVEPLAGPDGAVAPDDGVGEIVYRGPNVMLGYAESPADLARGRDVDALRTGDLGRVRPDGLVEVVGRRSRFVKPFGVRVDLDALERLLADRGHTAACTGTDDHVDVAVARGEADFPDAAAVRRAVTDRLPVPASAVRVVVLDALPRRANGKLDHPAVAALAEAAEPAPAPARGWGWRRRSGWGPAPTRSVREVYARTFPAGPVPGDASFVDLGGDSLTYVTVSADVERALGHLPPDWDNLPLDRLEEIEHAPGTAAPTAGRTRWWSGAVEIETVVVLRATAILLVVGEHMHLWSLLGGAHLLLAVAGWTFARFALAVRPADATAAGPAVDRWALPRRILRSAALVAVPSSLWIAFRAATQPTVHWSDALLAGSILHPTVQGYWFADALVQILLLAAAVFAVPGLRRLERRRPFAVACGALGTALLARLLPDQGSHLSPDLYSTHLVIWLFVLGWVVHRAVGPDRRALAAAAVLVLVPAFFDGDPGRAAVVAGGLLVLMLVPRLRLPRALAAGATTVASASLGIYLTHFALLGLLAHGVPSWALVPAAVGVGVGSWWAVISGVRAVGRAGRD